ncbi:MAG: PEP-CTERM system histidine kinase PrsK, partial [Deltaproteobacteria bacterium]|nr:PEP-CTERM system histidine kinase PrsK [Deltaproteobacteria bacterium]
NSLSLVSQNFNHNMENPEFRRDAVRAVDNTVAMMKGLIERLSTLPKGLVINKEECNLNALVRSVIKRIPMDGKEVIISNEIESVFPVLVDKEAMGMVFLNMFMNAFEAAGANGRITVSASKNGDTADITIADNGAGIPFEFIERDLFKPFKTTKRNGLGIGLFQCKAIVEAHGGRIAVKSAPGQGTTFNIVLPVVKAS